MLARSLAAGVCLIVLAGCTADAPAPTKAESIRRGDQLSAQQRYTEAAAAYRAAVAADPEDGKLRLTLARTYGLARSWTKAAEEAARASELLPDDVDVQILAASFTLPQGRYEDVVYNMSKLLANDPNNVGAIILWGNATARLPNTTWALAQLDDVLGDDDRYWAAFSALRPRTTEAEDEAAEAAFQKALRIAPANLDAQLALINFQWATRRHEEAEPSLRSLADQNPRHEAASHALGAFYLSRHRDAEGEHYLKQAAAAGPLGRDARFALADHYVTTGRDGDAAALLGSMAAADDETGDVSTRLAAIEFRLGNGDQAVRRLDALLARQKDNPRAVLLKTQFLLERGELDQALKFARDSVAAAPRSSEARSQLGRALVARGDLENAFDEYVEAVKLNPDGSAGSEKELARLSVALGREEPALAWAREVVRRNPSDRDATLLLVKALILARDYLAAERELKALAARDPDSPDVLATVGAVHAARRSDEAAMAAFARAIQADRDSLDALSGMVSLDLKAQRLAVARKRVDEALAAHPRDPGYLHLASRVYAAGNDTARTESTLRQVLDLDRGHQGAALSLAELLARERRADEATRVLDQLLERRPRSTDARAALATLLEQLGRTAEARQQYVKLLEQDPRSAIAASRLAVLKAPVGK